MHFRVGNGEFGDIYHVACAYQLDESVTVEFQDFPAGQEFMENDLALPIRTVEGQVQHLGETAKVIFDRYHDRRVETVSKSILRMAQEQGWRVPSEIEKLLTPRKKILLWHRKKDYRSHRNSSQGLLRQLAGLCAMHDTEPVLIGASQIEDWKGPTLVNFWTDSFFEKHSIAKQLWCLHQLFKSGGVMASLGMMSGAMDGLPMFFGHKTIFLARHSDATPRMTKVSSSVPNLIWQPIEYVGTLKRLTPSELSAIEGKIWR